MIQRGALALSLHALMRTHALLTPLRMRARVLSDNPSQTVAHGAVSGRNLQGFF